MNLYRPSAMALLATALAFALAACSDKEQTTQTLEPVAFHASDECHVCGMIIADFPGPKGEAVASNGVKKFCSTAELLGWWLQPDHWGQGVASAAAARVVAQAFALPEVTRVFAPIHGGNTRSESVARKIGMRLEGVQPRSAFKRGQVIDRVIYAAYR